MENDVQVESVLQLPIEVLSKLLESMLPRTSLPNSQSC